MRGGMAMIIIFQKHQKKRLLEDKPFGAPAQNLEDRPSPSHLRGFSA